MKKFVITSRCEYLGTIKARDYVHAYQKAKKSLIKNKFFDPENEKCEMVYVDGIPALHITKETTLERFYLNEEKEWQQCIKSRLSIMG
jgi:hypothetical protein